MVKMPKVNKLYDGSTVWCHEYDGFEAKVYIPKCELLTDVINYGFIAPYMMVFEENKLSLEEAKHFADENGLAKIAANFGGSVVFIYPTNEGGWNKAPKDLFESIISESRISQYYKDGVAIMRNRFTGVWGEHYIRGGVLRTYLYGYGASANYIAINCLKRIDGDGLYGKGDITPVVCILQNLSVIPKPERRDIPVVSVGNSSAVNEALNDALDYVLVKDHMEYEEDFIHFIGSFRRMVGHLEKEVDLEQMNMVMEPGFCVVPTSVDNQGDDKGSVKHSIGYVAYYNKRLMESDSKVPLLLCFHGGGDSAMCMASLSGWSQVAAKYDFLLVSVENHLNSTATETMSLIEHLKANYKIDTCRIYSTGFSMGGCKSWDMFQEYPNVFAAVAPMSATFDVGLNSYGQKVEKINQDMIVPVFYVGGEITPLPELPFQEEKCVNRMKYVLEVNQAVTKYNVKLEDKDTWENPIWGIHGDFVYHIKNDERENSILTLNLFMSKNGCCYSIFGSVSNQGHEVRHHSCENAWKFLSQFSRLSNGEVVGGKIEDIRTLYEG